MATGRVLMFGRLQEMMKNWQTMQQLMKDESFRQVITHPKMQELFKDESFQQLLKTQDISKLSTHPKVISLMQNPELAKLLSSVARLSIKDAS